MNEVVLDETIAERSMLPQSKTPSLLQLNRSCNGQDGGVSFFLPPYCQIVELVWSSGVKKEKKPGKGTKMTVFDSRPWYMNYEFVVRTSDNVELLLSISFFWSLENIAFMIRNTDDAPGDICHHARSEIIQAEFIRSKSAVSSAWTRRSTECSKKLSRSLPIE